MLSYFFCAYAALRNEARVVLMVLPLSDEDAEPLKAEGQQPLETKKQIPQSAISIKPYPNWPLQLRLQLRILLMVNAQPSVSPNSQD